MVRPRLRLMGRLIAGCVLAVMLASVASTPAAADELVQLRDVGTRRFPQVDLTVWVDGLVDRSAMTIEENGTPMTIEGVTSLGTAGAGVDVMLAIDVSNSMAGQPLRTAFASAERFLDQVPSWVNVGVVNFARASTLVAAPGDESLSLSQPHGTVGGTALYDAVVTAAGAFDGDAQRNVIVLTDGRNTTGTADEEAAIEAAEAADATLFTIGLGDATDTTTLRTLAEATGGTYATATQDDLGVVYESLADRLSQQLVVTYRSAAPVGVTSTVRVTAGSGHDAARFIAPAPSAGPVAAPDALTRFLRGPWGLLAVMIVTYVALFLLLDLVLGRQSRRRQRAALDTRMVGAGRPVTAVESTGDEATGPLAWIPEPVTDAAERVAGASTGSAIARALERAAWSIRAGELVVASVLAFILATVLGVSALPVPVLGIVVGMLAGAIPWLLLSRAVRQRSEAFQQQLPDLLMVIATSLRAGHSFMQSLDTVTHEVDDPAATEFARVVTEIRLGRPTDETLIATADRMGSSDFTWAVMAINIQRQVGGNLAEVLETVANTIRERETVRRQVRVLSAEGRLSIAILFAMPFLLAGYLLVVNPEYLSALTTSPIGLLMLGAALLLMAVGYVWMRRIIDLDV